MANPYYIQTLGGKDPANIFQGLLDTRKQRQDEELALKQQQDLQALTSQAATGDADAIGQLWSVNPEMAQFMEQREAKKVADMGLLQAQESKRAETDWGIRWKQAGPEQKEALLQEALQNPLIDIDEDDVGVEGEQADLAVNTMLYGHLGKDGYKQLLGEQRTAEDTRTATQKEFSQYLQLKRDDPNAAAEFGRSAGFLTEKAKRLFQVKKNDDGTTTKYFSDGTEETVPASEKVKTPDMKNAMSQDQALRVIDKAKEGQLKNAGFALTLNDGLEQTKALVDKGYDPSSAAWVAKYLEGTTIGNLMLDDQDQLFLGSVEQMINAIARRETGAAITAFERKDFFQRYLPMPGDSKARQDQKQKALERQFKSIRGQSGSVYDAIRLTQGIDEKPTEQKEALTSMTRDQYNQLPAGSEYEIGGVRYIKGQ